MIGQKSRLALLSALADTQGRRGLLTQDPRVRALGSIRRAFLEDATFGTDNHFG